MEGTPRRRSRRQRTGRRGGCRTDLRRRLHARPAELLEGCLAALERQTHPAYEVVVVDNAPDRRLHARGRAPLRRPLRRRAAARPRLGAQPRAREADRRSSPTRRRRPPRSRAGWTGTRRGLRRRPTSTLRPASCARRARDQRRKHLFEDVYWRHGQGIRAQALHPARRKSDDYRPDDCGVGCNMAFRTEALERLGGFDPALDVGTPTGGGGDLDVFQRILDERRHRLPPGCGRPAHASTHLGRPERQLYDNGRAYSSTLWVALLRARGRNRLGVVAAYWRWIWRHHAEGSAAASCRRDESLPLSFLFAELRGAPLWTDPLHARPTARAPAA